MTHGVEFGPAEELGDAEPDSEAVVRPRRRWLAGAVVGAIVVLLAGAGAYATTLLSGGGVQPQDVLPAGAIGYARIDLDPAANQKIALLGFAGKFDAMKAEHNDPRAVLGKLLSGDVNGVDFARDVDPWLGDRLGVALLPPSGSGTQPDAVYAVEVTDEDAARAGIDKLWPDTHGVAFLDGYAIVARTQARADGVVAETQERPLAENAAFSEDLAAIGEPGVFSFWVDGGKLSGLIGKSGRVAGGGDYILGAFANARVAGALRFSNDYAELAGLTRGITQPPMRYGPVHIGELPASTALAVSFSGLDNVIAAGWSDSQARLERDSGFSEQRAIVDTLRDGYGVTFPDDLEALLAGNLTLALELGEGAPPKVGLVKRSYSPKAEEVRLKLEALYADSRVPFGSALFRDGIVLSNSQEYANRLGHSTELGNDPTFRKAVADVRTATYAAYIDLDKFEKGYLPRVTENRRGDVARFRAIGFSAQHDTDIGSFNVRLVLN